MSEQQFGPLTPVNNCELRKAAKDVLKLLDEMVTALHADGHDLLDEDDIASVEKLRAELDKVNHD